MRIFGFRTSEPGDSTDAFLRATVERGLVAMPAVRYVYSARGSDYMGDPRQVVSIWDDTADVSQLIAPFPFEESDVTRRATVELSELELELAFTSPDPPGILRIFRGRTLPGEMDAYVDDVRAGTTADFEAGFGPMALFLGTDDPDSFVTVSLWTDWDRIARATGGNYRAPISTRHSHRLVEWSAAHFEIVPKTICGAVSPADRRHG